MAVTVKITETYDMKTTVNKIGLVGVHTPSNTLLKKLYPGLMKNHRFIRFLKADVVGACASVLPADPLQIGVSEGTVAPEDMFNPILYTAVTNSSFDTLVARIRDLAGVSALGSVDAGDFNNQSSTFIPPENMFKIYYSLLAENGKYRKAMPQSGFSIKGLVPLAHTVISTFGNVGPIGNTYALAEDGENSVPVPDLEIPEVSDSWAATSNQEILYRGKPIRMPKIPIHVGPEDLTDTPNPNIPKTHVLALILPPARLHEFYYRMRVSWTVRFEDVVSTLEAGSLTAFADVGANSHGTNYSYSAKSELEKSEDMVDATSVDINKIMES